MTPKSLGVVLAKAVPLAVPAVTIAINGIESIYNRITLAAMIAVPKRRMPIRQCPAGTCQSDKPTATLHLCMSNGHGNRRGKQPTGINPCIVKGIFYPKNGIRNEVERGLYT